jgi:hypothetical protein
MKLLIDAEWLGRTSRIKILLNFCHFIRSSLDLGERSRRAQWIVTPSLERILRTILINQRISRASRRDRLPLQNLGYKRGAYSLISCRIASLWGLKQLFFSCKLRRCLNRGTLAAFVRWLCRIRVGQLGPNTLLRERKTIVSQS